MARRTAVEISTTLKGMFGEQTPEGYLELLEDIADSVGTINPGEYVSRADYEKVVGERDAAIQGERDMRDKYINRFYNDYNDPNDKGLILGETTQGSLEKEEEDLSYESLFE